MLTEPLFPARRPRPLRLWPRPCVVKNVQPRRVVACRGWPSQQCGPAAPRDVWWWPRKAEVRGPGGDAAHLPAREPPREQPRREGAASPGRLAASSPHTSALVIPPSSRRRRRRQRLLPAPSSRLTSPALPAPPRPSLPRRPRLPPAQVVYAMLGFYASIALVMQARGASAKTSAIANAPAPGAPDYTTPTPSECARGAAARQGSVVRARGDAARAHRGPRLLTLLFLDRCSAPRPLLLLLSLVSPRREQRHPDDGGRPQGVGGLREPAGRLRALGDGRRGARADAPLESGGARVGRL